MLKHVYALNGLSARGSAAIGQRIVSRSLRAWILGVWLVVGMPLLGLFFTSQPVLAQDSIMTPTTDLAAQATNSVFLVEYPFAGTPTRIEAENAGRVWATLPQIDAIGSISITDFSAAATSYVTRTYQLAPGSRPYALAVQGTTIWFTANGLNQIGKLTPSTGTIQVYPIPAANSGPAGIAVAPNGEIWFTLQTANKLGRFNPTTSAFQLYDYPLANGGLDEVAMVTSTSIWFTAPNLNQVINYNVTRNDFVPLSTSPYAQLSGLAIDSSNDAWVSVRSANRVGRYAPGTLALWRWQALFNPTAPGPQRIALSRGSGPWHLFYANQSTQRVGLLNIASNTSVGRIREAVPPATCQPLDIAVTSNRDAWFTCGTGNAVIRWVAPFSWDLFLPITSRR